MAQRPQRSRLGAPRAVWKCIPRAMFLPEREWLSWMNSPGMPLASYTLRQYVSEKKPRSSPNTRGLISFTSGSLHSMISIGRSLWTGAAERADVGDRVVHQPRPHARGPELLGLAPAAHAHAVPQAREAVEHLGRVVQRAGPCDLDVVEPQLEPVRRRQPLAQHEVAGGEMQAHAVLEARVVLVVDVDADVVLVERLLELRRADAEREVQ